MFLTPRLLPFIVLLGCSGGGDPPPPNTHCSGFVGDMAKAPEIQILYRDVDGQVQAAADGSRLPLIEPPQGGRVVFAGVRARNVDTCPLQLTGALRDVDTNRVHVEVRPVSFLRGDDGWAYAEQQDQISSYTNIAVCPNAWSSKNVYEESYRLELAVKDKDGRSAQAAVMVTPYCAEPATLSVCNCICHVDYKLGQCPGEPDAGL